MLCIGPGSERTTSVMTSPGCTAVATIALFAGSRRLSSAVKTICHMPQNRLFNACFRRPDSTLNFATKTTCHKSQHFALRPGPGGQSPVCWSHTGALSFSSQVEFSRPCEMSSRQNVTSIFLQRQKPEKMWVAVSEG